MPRTKSIQRANNTGSVYKLSGNRSKPWRAIITKGWTIDEETQKSKQIRETIGYYSTRDEAMQSLINYNANPYDISAGKQTFANIYEKWSSEKFPTISHSNVCGYQAAFKRCELIANKPFKDIGLDELQGVIDSSECNYPTLKKIKILFNQLFEYAIPRNLTDKDYSAFVNIKKYEDKNPNKFDRKKFSNDEIKTFWNHTDIEIGKIMLMLIYSGLRISELLNLKKADCFLGDKYVSIIQSKTSNGIRLVPISDKTLDFWLYFFNKCKDNEYLVTMDGRSFEGTSKEKGYRSFRDTYYLPYTKSLGMNDRQIHETRYTCISLLESKEVSQAKINRIVGHSGKTVAENVYMQLDIEDLIDAINKI